MNLLKNLLSLLVVLAMLGVGALFALQNEATVPLDILVYRFEPHSVALWVLAGFALGGLFGMLTMSVLVLRLRTRLGLKTRQLAKVQAESESSRSRRLVESG
jgi:putative membrane protein